MSHDGFELPQFITSVHSQVDKRRSAFKRSRQGDLLENGTLTTKWQSLKQANHFLVSLFPTASPEELALTFRAY